MKVFKMFFKLISKQKALVIVYSVLVLFFTLVYGLFPAPGETNYQDMKASVKVIVEEESKFSTDLVNYLDPFITKKNIDAQHVDDALAFQEITAQITIKKAAPNVRPEVEVYSFTPYLPSLMNLKTKLNDYLSYVDLLMEDGATLSEALDLASEDLAISNVNYELTSEVRADTILMSALFMSIAYTLFFGASAFISTAMMQLNKPLLKNRSNVSGYSVNKASWEKFLASFIIVIGVGIVSVLGAIIFFPNEFMISGGYYILNVACLIVPATTFALLVSVLFKSDAALSGFITTFLLLQAFFSGTFVPLKYLGDVKIVSYFFVPTYYNRNAALIAEGNISSQFYLNLGIILLFGLAFLAAYFIIQKVRERESR